ncbi:hypothetical protein ACFDR9_005114 [Janthinobacterium sp. CG_23.3]|uniref:hypothetical protein n=1 Tax=Janthinobacterium sp. CG_23.3 TaxID=3349634 RepID=UPI0038D3C37E
MGDAAALTIIKIIHTIAWAFFAACVLAIPIAAWRGELSLALGLIFIVLVEVLILAANKRRCPLTKLAARYTDDRRDNFNIHLPLWLARHNKQVFGGTFFCGFAFHTDPVARLYWIAVTIALHLAPGRNPFSRTKTETMDVLPRISACGLYWYFYQSNAPECPIDAHAKRPAVPV